MEEALVEFLRHLALEKNASAHTVKSYALSLDAARMIADPGQIFM